MENLIVAQETQCQQHLAEWTQKNADAFSLEEFCEFHGLRPKDAVVLVSQLTDVDIMHDMIEGDFLSFDLDLLITQPQ